MAEDGSRIGEIPLDGNHPGTGPRTITTDYGSGVLAAAAARLPVCYGVIAMAPGPIPTGIGLPTVPVAVCSGITVPGVSPGSKTSLTM